MQLPTTVQTVLSHYPADCLPSQVAALDAAGGFSGAKFWRLDSPRGLLCLRRWPPEHPSAEQLAWIHAVVGHVKSSGFLLLPSPIQTVTGATFVQHDACLWELTTWLPGRADYHTAPNLARLNAALTALAQFHLAASSFPRRDDELLQTQRSPAIRERLAMVEQLLDGRWRLLHDAVTEAGGPLRQTALEILSLIEPHLPTLRDELQSAASLDVQLQPCLRDIWHDHVLFVGNEVTGIVDLGSMRLETVAADVSRLIGSLCGGDRESWTIALTAYEAVRPLSDGERTLLPAFDRSQVMLAGINWIEWVYMRRRQFSDPAAVEKRMTGIWRRLVEYATEGVA